MRAWNSRRRINAPSIGEVILLVTLVLLLAAVVIGFGILTYLLARGAFGDYTDDTHARVLYGIVAVLSGLTTLRIFLAALISWVES